MGYLVSGDPVPRSGTASPTAAPSQMYRCQDGAIMLVVGNKAQWEKFARVLGRPDLPADPRFVTNQDRSTIARRSTPCWTDLPVAAEAALDRRAGRGRRAPAAR
jgi:crotonobetainyl-CoA:carnitine CoA-transferase CaiB-like acyl-CoA transferase